MVLYWSRRIETREETKTIEDRSYSLRLSFVQLSVILGVCHEVKLSIQRKEYKTDYRRDK